MEGLQHIAGTTAGATDDERPPIVALGDGQTRTMIWMAGAETYTTTSGPPPTLQPGEHDVDRAH